MTHKLPNTSKVQNRSKLLLGTGCAAMAMGMLVSAERAEAQAINASETFVQGSGNRITPGPVPSDIIEIDTPTAVIDWVPFEDGAGNALDFLPVGSDVTFVNSPSNLGDFAVLNRILPATNGNVTVIDGTVVSQLVDAMGATTPGGTVAFYSPTGLLIGDNASFDVGNLILTTLDIDLASFDAFTQAGGTLSMALGPNGPQTITISPNATITASAENSYFVVTAAQIEMFGTSDVNGTQAFVAGDEVLLTLNNGLFDIEVPVGTSSANAININGNVGGPSSTGVGDNHLIYAVAAAQADPISLLFSGNLGFEPAASAGIVNGEIIISANYDVFGRDVAGGTIEGGIFQEFEFNELPNPVQADIFIEDFASTSSIFAAATNEVQVAAVGGASSIDGNLIMLGRGFSELTASNGQTFDITGDVLVSANKSGFVDTGILDPTAIDGIGGTAFIDAFGGGTLNIAGSARVTSTGSGGFDLDTNEGGLGQGGSAQIGSTGGTLTIGGDAFVAADGGGIANTLLQTSRDSNGGFANIFARDGGQVAISGAANVSAVAAGRNGAVIDAVGSNSNGGFASLESTNGGDLLITGNTFLDASATGGISNSSTLSTLADAGDARVSINGTGSIEVTGGLIASARAFGGMNTGGAGGEAIGGSAGIAALTGGSFTTDGLVDVDVSALAGSGLTVGGDGLGGIADIVANGGATITINNAVELSAFGTGAPGQDGGDGFGGVTAVFAEVGTISIAGNTFGFANGFGGSASSASFGGNGGNGTGGRSQIVAAGNQTEIGEVSIGGFASIAADGNGGVGGAGDGSIITPGAGGEGIGGSDATLVAVDPGQTGGAFLIAGLDNGLLTISNSAAVNASGRGGAGGEGAIGQDGGLGANGIGGLSRIAILPQGGGNGTVGLGSLTTGTLNQRTDGRGGNGGAFGTGGTQRGDGGDGTGGTLELQLDGGSFEANALTQISNGIGATGANGGEGTGGSVSFLADGGATGILNLSIFGSALGIGGVGENGAGGTGTGGLAQIRIGDANIQGAQDAELRARATGGSSLVGRGGDAIGGRAELDTNDVNSVFTLADELFLDANATAGASVTALGGADATGGAANIFADAGGSVTVASVSTFANAVGGSNSGPGGNGVGGSSLILVADDGTLVTTTGGVEANAQATGGASTGGAVGGNATGGVANLLIGFETGSVGTLTSQTSLVANADATGGSGIGGGNATGGAALVQVQSGDLTAQTSVVVSANGTGGISNLIPGVGGDGGDGTGGLALIGVFGADARTASLDAGAGSLNVVANGIGGRGGSGDGSFLEAGNGGDGFGGSTRTANVAIPSQNNGALLLIGDVNSTINVAGSTSVAAAGAGGVGGDGGLDQAGGDGGNGFGGTAVFGNVGFGTDDADDLNDGTSVATIAGLTLNNSGIGGAGGFSGSTFGPRGNGGDGAGGISDLNGSNDQAVVSATGVTLNIGAIDALSNGTGGDGDIAGDGFGGIALLNATSGGIVTAASINAEASGFGGNGRIGGNGDAGGAADPGQVFGGAGIDFRNGTITITDFANFTASGFGGASDGGDGGIGTGGFASFRNLGLGDDPTLQGDLDIGGFASLLAEGIGGDGGAGLTGGIGQGGLAEIVTAVGGTVEIGTAEIAAGGAGGSGVSTAGGNGFGGVANIISRDTGSSITINNELGFADSVSQTGQRALLSANGGGGTATGGTGVGGDGTGGTASVIATDQGSITLPLVTGFGNRILARGGGGASGVDGGLGGIATGGTGIVELDNGGVITTGRTLLSVFAFAGSSTEAFDPASTLNVDGGDAEGGERRITVRGGSTLTGEFFGGTAGALGGDGSGTGNGGSGAGGRGVYVFEDSTFNAVGRNIFGGGGGSGGRGQIGGNASGGDNDFTVTNATINMISNGESTNPAGLPDTPSIQIFNQSLNGDGILQGGNVTGGTIDVTITDSTITGGTFGISELARAGNADAVIGTGGNATAGSITLNVANSALEVQNGEDTQGFIFDPATGMNVPGDITPGEISSIVSTAQGGAGLVAGNASAGNVDVTFLGGSVAINPSSTAEGVLEFASLATAGDGTDQLGTAISGRVDVTFTSTNITGDNLLIRSDATSEAIQTGATGGEAIAGSADLVIFGNSAVTLNNLTVSANGTSAPGGEAQGGSAGLLIAEFAGVPAPQVNLDSLVLEADGQGATPGNANNTHGQFILDVIDSQLNTRELNASADGDVLASGEIGPSIINADGGAIEVDEQINLTTFADAILNTVNGGTIGTGDILDPSPAITITSQNTIQFTGDDDNAIGVAGSVLNLSSSDMIIGDGARIGAPEVNITSLNREDTAILGGDGTPGGQVADEGFTLIGEELERIEVARFTFNQEVLPVDQNGSANTPGTQVGQAVGPNDPSIIVRDYTASGSDGDGISNISLNVTGAGGILRVEGQAGLVDAIATDTFALSAEERIEIVTPGGVGVLDLDGAPIGTLLIDARNVWAADAATITQLQNDPNFAGRNEFLSGAATGSADPLGFIRAGEVSITFGDTLLVRNTGTDTEQGGILVGDGGLFITDSTDSIADVFAYGARLDSDTGELVTGEAFFDEVQFAGGASSSTGSASFNDSSAFNNCLINTIECAATTQEPEEPSEEEEIIREEAAQGNNATTVEAAVQTAVEVAATEEESNEDFGMDFPSFVEAEGIDDESDIDDPVASGGDASLYGRGAGGNVEVGGSSDGE